MAKALAYTHTDTAVGGVSSLTVPIPVLNLGADFRVMKDTPEEAIISNMTSQIGYPEKIRFASRVIPDAYKGSDVDASLRSLNKRGVEVLVSHTDTAAWTDSEDPTFLELKTPKMNVVFTFPADGSYSADAALDYIKRSIACLFETGGVTSARVNALLRGILIPADL